MNILLDLRTYTALAVLLALVMSVCTYRLQPAEIGLKRDWITGETVVVTEPGIRLKMPWVMVAHIDTRPMRVCVTSAARAILSCKLVRFNPQHIDGFLKVEGFRLYWWSNRLSFNMGHEETYRGFADIMRGYAFSSVSYSFIEEIDAY